MDGWVLRLKMSLNKRDKTDISLTSGKAAKKEIYSEMSGGSSELNNQRYPL